MNKQLRKLSKDYSVLGGVVAPKSSAFTIAGMPNPKMERNTIPLDHTLPSLRFNTAVANFNNFNPYRSPRVATRELFSNRQAVKYKRSEKKLMNVVNRFSEAKSPILPKKFFI